MLFLIPSEIISLVCADPIFVDKKKVAKIPLEGLGGDSVTILTVANPANCLTSSFTCPFHF
jgi:hypothetical protein